MRDTASWKKTSGVGLYFGDGWMDVYRSKKVGSTTSEVDNVASSLTAGGNVAVSARADIDVVGSAVVAAGEARLAAGRDVTLSPGMEAEGSTYSRKVSGIGIGVSAGNGSASLSLGAHRDSLYQSRETTRAEASLVQGGTGVVITAGRDISATAADIVSGGDIAVTAGRDLAMLAATEVARELEIRKQSFVGLKAEISQNVTGALEQLKGAASTFNSGYGSDAYKAIGMASGIMQGVDAALQLSNPTVSGSITVGASSSTSRRWSYSETARPTTLTAAGDLTLTAGRDMHLQGTQAEAGRDLTLDVGRDLLVESAQSGYGSFQSSSSKSVGVGAGFSLSLRGGFTAGLAANGSIAHARDEMSGIQNLNAVLKAGETLTIVTGRHATLAGADATGRDVLLDIGGDLTVASRQDTGHGSSRSSSVGGSLFIGGGTSPISGSISVGGGRGSSDRAWVGDQTSIIARGTLDARVGGHTQIDGAVIASLTGDLTLATGTLGFSDLHDRDRGSSWSAEAGLSFAIDRDKGDKGQQSQKGQEAAQGDKPGYTAQGRPTGASLSGQVAEHDRAQETRATVGAGTIVIRDTEKQTQDVAALNRDLDRAQEITKDKRSGVAFYVSSSAIQEIASGFAGTRDNLDKLGKAAAEGFPQLPADIAAALAAMQQAGGTLTDALSSLFDARGDAPAATKAEALGLFGEVMDGKLSLAAVQACASQGGFNLLDLFIGRAHAGVCEQYSREAIALCLDGLDKLRSAVSPYGTAIAGYFADRIAADPDGFAKAMRALDLLPSSLILDQFAAEARQAFERSGGRVEDLADAMGTFLAKHLVALGNGEFSPEVATGLIAAAVFASMKFVSKDARAGFAAKISDTVRELYGAVKGANRAQLIDDLVRGGTKITPANVVDIRRLPDGRTVWLETGDGSAGLQHINRHADEFAQKGISQAQIPDALFTALGSGKVVGYQGTGTGRPIYEYSFNGQTHRMAITVGSNGFIVGANPTSLP